MKVFMILLCMLLLEGIGGSFIYASGTEFEQVNCGNCLVMMDDYARMDKLFTPIRYELLYSGTGTGKVYFKHNEYLCDEHGFVKKTGYSRNIEYDLNKSNVIDYRGLKIEIISADEKELKYRIIQGNRKPEGAK